MTAFSLCSLANEPLRIAVAANFKAPLNEIIAAFKKHNPAKIDIMPGSTGKLYLQIAHGAPYHLFLAADSARPLRLINEGKALPGSQKVYAVGKLALCGKDIKKFPLREVLMSARKITLSNPRVSPYGVASQEYLEENHHWNIVKDKIILGQDIAQTHQYLERNLVDVGIVALSQLYLSDNTIPYIVIPAHQHKPLHQQMVLLPQAEGHEIAKLFYVFLQSNEAKEIIHRWGYRVR